LTNKLAEFEQEEDPSSRSFFSEIISSISDVRFSNDGRYILSRDYLTVKIWDVNMERQPVKTIPIHEHLRPRLCDTYENDSIFDKFEVVFSGDGSNVMTGSYNNNFMIYPSDPERETEVVLQADKSAFKAKKVGVPTPINNSTSPTSGGKKGTSRAGSPAAGASGQGGRMRKETDADQIDFNKKILHMSWHPFEDSIAIAATNNVSLLDLAERGYMESLTAYLAVRLLRVVELRMRLAWIPRRNIIQHEAFGCNRVLGVVEYLNIWIRRSHLPTPPARPAFLASPIPASLIPFIRSRTREKPG
jgi:WD40 repeat protein